MSNQDGPASFGRVSVMRRGSSVVVGNTHLQVTYELSTGLWSYADGAGKNVIERVGAKWSDVDGTTYATSDPCRRVFRARPITSEEHGSGAEVVFSHATDETPASTELIMRIFSDAPFAVIRLRIENTSSDPIRVGRLDLVDVPATPGIPIGGVTLGRDPAECRLYLNGSRIAARGVLGFEQGAVYPDEQIGEPISDGILFDPRSLRAVTFGFLHGGRWWSGARVGYDAHGVEADPAATRVNIWNVFQLCEGARCPRDGALDSEPLYVNVSTSALESQAHFSATAIGPRAVESRELPGVSNYVKSQDGMPPLAERVGAIVDAIGRKSEKIPVGPGGLRELRLATGWVGSVPPDLDSQFPSGVRAAVDVAHTAGLRIAADASPFLIASEAEAQFDDAVLRTQNGRPAILTGDGVSGMRALDPTNPRTRDYVSAQISRICGDWGVDTLYVSLAPFREFVAQDVARHRWRDQNLTRMQILHGAYELVNDAQRDVAPNASLVWIDLPQGVAFATDGRSTCGLDDFYRSSTPSWSGQWGVRELIRAATAKAYTHRRWSEVEIGPISFFEDQTSNESQLLLTVGLMSGAHLCLSDDLTKIGLEGANLLGQCLPLMDSPARTVRLDSTSLYAWIHPVRTAFGDWDVLAIANLSDLYEDIEIPFADMGLSRAQRFVAYEVWDRVFYGMHQRSLSVFGLPPRAAKLFALREETDVPMLIASDLHVSQGAEDLITVGWDARSESLLGAVKRVPRGHATMILYVPDLYVPAGIGCVGAKYSYEWLPPVMELHLTGDDGPALFDMRFARTEG